MPIVIKEIQMQNKGGKYPFLWGWPGSILFNGKLSSRALKDEYFKKKKELQKEGRDPLVFKARRGYVMDSGASLNNSNMF